MTIKELLQLETKSSAYTPPPTREAMMADNRALRIELAKQGKPKTA